MMTWIKLAIRNLFRNGRRSFFTILAISLGFAAVNALGGFTAYIFTNLKNAYIYNQANGHLCIFKQGFLHEGKLNPTQYLLDEADVSVIRAVLHGHPEVVVASPQLHISGLLSNGQVSTIFIAAGRVPSEVRTINSAAMGGMAKIKLFTGKQLEDNLAFGVGLSKGLAEQLKFELGATAVAMAPTVSGQINALDAEVLQVFDSPVEALEDKLMLVPLKFAQSLYDTTGIDRLIVLVQNDAQTEPMRALLAQELAEHGLKLDIKTWNELSPFYTKVKQMFDVIFMFTFLIVFTIVVMSVINTVGMAIMERTREIGTLRALGLKRRGIIGLFAIESMLLGFFGSLLGVMLTLSVWWGIKVMEPTWIPPQITSRIPLEIYLVPYYMLYSTLLLVALSLIAACLPARKAARMEIVSALGHV
ncbi:MAG: FtsX-like permease family protein [Methylococcales bacterium]|nr:FtsX-like permease family protein [Methylococcales bacterium]